MIKERYIKNLGAISEAEVELLGKKSVCVVGCGGLGGYIIEMLARIGIGSLTVVDGDSFTLSNLNRQLYCTEALIGESKVSVASERIQSINSSVYVKKVPSFISKENADDILQNHDLVIDALDNVSARRTLAESCGRLNIPLIHGAISGWCAQITVIAPNSGTFDSIYPKDTEKSNTPSLSFTPALAASIQAAEALKILLGKESTLQNKLLLVDLFTQEYKIIKI